MKFIDNKRVMLNADDEEPNCLTCDNMGRCMEGEDPLKGGTDRCGPLHGWQGYYRIARREEGDAHGTTGRT